MDGEEVHILQNLLRSLASHNYNPATSAALQHTHKHIFPAVLKSFICNNFSSDSLRLALRIRALPGRHAREDF